MEQDIQLDPALTSGVDEGIGRRGVDWDYVKQAVTQHHQGIRDANRRRGQDTFNRLIGTGVPYAEALRQAGDDGLFYDDNEGQQRAYQRMETLKAQNARGGKDFHEPGVGILRFDNATGKYNNVFPFPAKQTKPVTSGLLQQQRQINSQLMNSNFEVRNKPALRLQLQKVQEALGENGIPIIPEPETRMEGTNSVPFYPSRSPHPDSFRAATGDQMDAVPEAAPPVVPVNQKALTADIAKDFVKQARGDKAMARKLARDAGYNF